MLKAYIFGSYARNEADVDSDIDLLVELDYCQRIGLGFVGMQNELERKATLGRLTWFPPGIIKIYQTLYWTVKRR